MLKKLGKPFSSKSVQPGCAALPRRLCHSNTGYRGLYYREYSYHKRGIKQFTKVIDVRWWSEKLGKWGHTTVAVKKHGRRAKAIRAALEVQKRLEEDHAVNGGSGKSGS